MNGEPLSVLLVDDEGVFISVIAEQLRTDYGFKTTVAYSGIEALRLLKEGRESFDVILLDYKMPQISGLNVLQWMYEQKLETPVIMLTAAGSEFVAVEAMKFGAYDYLRKEEIEIPHLALAIRATHERHLFRIQKAIEEERAREIRLNKEATEVVHTVLNQITPTLNGMLAGIAADLEAKGAEIGKQIPGGIHEKYVELIKGLKRQMAVLEGAIQEILNLYRFMYAKHTDTPEIQQIKARWEGKMKEVAEQT
ncbi:MAG TPA: response regulator [Bacteroidota bacterium]|nr:response regulator [Bacteroidota bacterium]